jgi:hypothetical protein
MDVLNAVVKLVEEAALFASLEGNGIRHRLSLYADDVVMLIRPTVEEATAALHLVNTFGEASGLRCNLQKSSVSPIRCDGMDLQPITAVIQCPIKPFPVSYLGLPLSLARLSKTDLQPLVDKIAGHFPTWKASLLERSGRLILVNSTLVATPVYHMLSLDLPPWFFNCVNKLLRGFFWSAAMEARRGQCVVAWDSICSPKHLGGLGVKNLRLLNLALRTRWRWHERAEEDKPWKGLRFSLPEEAEEIFTTGLHCTLGDGQRLRFWQDRWIDGVGFEQMAPNLFKFLTPARREDTVVAALDQKQWATAFRGNLTVVALVEYLQMWERLQTVMVQQGRQDGIVWRGTASGIYTAKIGL